MLGLVCISAAIIDKKLLILLLVQLLYVYLP